MPRIIPYMLVMLLVLSANVIASSTKVTPPLNPQSHQGYTQPAALPSDVSAFIGDRNNVCRPNENRDQCFLQYTVSQNASPPPGTSLYRLDTPTLDCPSGYSLIGSFENKMYAPSAPGESIYYYDAINYSKITSMTQYDTLTSTKGMNCTQTVKESREACIHPECNPTNPDSKTVGGELWIKTFSNQFMRDTYSKYAKKCDHYTMTGCPDWCQRWPWENWKYSTVSCSRAAGFYPADISNTPPSHRYTPSIIVCGKHGIVWKPKP